MNSTRWVLQQARALIADKKHWTRESYARDKYGHNKDSRSPQAVRWCAMGSVRKVSDPATDEYLLAGNALRQASRILFDTNPMNVNDDKGHAKVLEVFDRAIANS